MSARALNKPIQPPGYGMLLLEPLRAALELAALPLLAPLPLTAKRGDGHSVLVIPGFTATDGWTAILRAYLNFLGYRAEAWELGRNMGYRNLGAEAEKLHARVREVRETSDSKISIVGWSMGGVMARRAARVQPDLVRQVVTLGAPFTGDPHALSIRGIYETLSGEWLDTAAAKDRFECDREQPPVPTTSIYTKTDGIASWRNCLEPEGAQAENIEVLGSHSGLVVNPLALRLLADRLAEPENGWKPYAGRFARASASRAIH